MMNIKKIELNDKEISEFIRVFKEETKGLKENDFTQFTLFIWKIEIDVSLLIGSFDSLKIKPYNQVGQLIEIENIDKLVTQIEKLM